ncbi:MAG: hypothetical protein ACI4AK_04370 [Lepagella sp.]
MRFFKTLSITLTVLASIAGVQTAQAGYTLSFASGKLPSDVVSQNPGSTPSSNGYKRGWTTAGWTVERFGDLGYVGLCPTYYEGDDETESCSSLTLPEVEVGENDYLIWTTRAMYPARRESYRIDVTEGQTEAFTTIGEYEDDANWTTRVVSLSEYAGKNITLTLTCTSKWGYMLMLSSLMIGTPESVNLVTTDLTTRYLSADDIADGTAPITLSVLNAGKTLDSGSLVCLVGLNDAASIAIDTPWATGETREVSFNVPAQVDKKIEYIVTYRDSEDSETDIAEDAVFPSTFARTLMVDKLTGMWCTNCPTGVLEVEKLEKRFGKNIVFVETHTKGTSTDALDNNEYFLNLNTYSVPNLMLNRITASKSSNSALFKSYYDRPTEFLIKLTNVTAANSNTINVSAEVTSANDLDNSTGRYRIGYVVTSYFYRPGNKYFLQINGCNSPSNEQFYYLPNPIYNDLVEFHNASLTCETAFDGMEGSIPEQLTAYQPASYSWEISRPELLQDINDGKVVVFILDTQTGEIQNAAAAMVGEVSGVKDIFDGAEETRHAEGIYNMQGIRLDVEPSQLPAGIYIIEGKKMLIK